MTSPVPPSDSSQFTESLNFRVSPDVKSRLLRQSDRLSMTQTSVNRLCLALGLEALENLTAQAPSSLRNR